MSHFIQPIEIDSTFYCCGCEGSRSTKGVLTTDYASPNGATITTDCGAWELFAGGESDDEGEISFGVSCGSTVEVGITSAVVNPTHDYTVDITVYVDGIVDHITTMYPGNNSETVSVSVTGSPCGTIVTAYAVPYLTENDFSVTVTMEVTSIT